MPCNRCELAAGPNEVAAKIPERPFAAIIGNNPVSDDEKAGEPFANANAKLLKMAIANYGLKEEDFIWLYALRCAPKGTKVKDDHLNACRNWIDQDLKKIRELPERLVLVCGGTPMDSLLYELELSGGYTANRGQWIENKGWEYLITFPPGYVSDLSPYRHDQPGMWWTPPGSVPDFWFRDIAKFAKRVKALKEQLTHGIPDRV